MTAFAKRHWVAILFACIAAVAVLRATWVEHRAAAAPAQITEVRSELAAARIDKAETQAKTQTRAARAHVDGEVTDAARASNLVDYLSSRGR